MSGYLVLKWIHVISSVVLVGVGFGSAFYFYFINRTRDVSAIAEIARLVVRADYWFTTPAVIVQPLTGFWMVSMAGYSLTESWLLTTYALFLFAGMCWLPVVWLQIRMARMAQKAAQQGNDLPSRYWSYGRWWTALGMLAFPAMLAVFALMVFKPNESG